MTKTKQNNLPSIFFLFILTAAALFLPSLGWTHSEHPELCPICGMKMPCPMKCLTVGKSLDGSQAQMVMPGVPLWLVFIGTGTILILSFVLIERLNRQNPTQKEYRTWDLLSIGGFRSWVQKPWFRTLCQLPIVVIFLFVIYAGLTGDQSRNIAPLLTWTIWWGGLIFLILFFGKAWCFLCPWDFISTCVQKIKLFGFPSGPMTLGLKWPSRFKNIILATGFFIILTWFELGFKITSSPRQTAILGIVMIALSVICALIFEKRSFCKYGCFVGRISGLYAMFSPVEIRAKDLHVCAHCKGKDCFYGNEHGSPCPTSLTVPAITENTYCLLCTECVKSCPHTNVALNIRPFACDLRWLKKIKPDESWLAIILLVLTSFHGLTMTPLWDSATQPSVIGSMKKLIGGGYLSAFSAGMALVNTLLISIYYLLCVITRWVVGNPSVSIRKIFLGFAYSLLPVALFYHLAHNTMHVFMEGQRLIPLISDPLGQGVDYFKTASLKLGPLLSADVIWYVQILLVVTGHVFGILIGHHVALKLYSDKRQALISLIPMSVCMIFFSFYSIWIMHLDMNMRSSLM